MARGRGARGKARGRGGGRGRKATRVIESDDEQETKETPMDEGTSAATAEQEKTDEPMPIDPPTQPSSPPKEELPAAAVPKEPVEEPRLPPPIDMEADISQLEAPTFTTIHRGPPEVMTKLDWSHRVNLIGEKVMNPMIHCCDQCAKPILIYGRMIPCKHVFCLTCARSESLKLTCPRCKEKAIRVEQTGLGTVFMCTHGGTRYESKGCRRTYLSQRDLQAHINHRHVTLPTVARLESLAVKITEGGGEAAKVTTATTTTAKRATIEPAPVPQRARTSSSSGAAPNQASVPVMSVPMTTQNYYAFAQQQSFGQMAAFQQQQQNMGGGGGAGDQPPSAGQGPFYR